METKICPMCSTSFDPPHHRSKYCGQPCADRAFTEQCKLNQRRYRLEKKLSPPSRFSWRALTRPRYSALFVIAWFVVDLIVDMVRYHS